MTRLGMVDEGERQVLEFESDPNQPWQAKGQFSIRNNMMSRIGLNYDRLATTV